MFDGAVASTTHRLKRAHTSQLVKEVNQRSIFGNCRRNHVPRTLLIQRSHFVTQNLILLPFYEDTALTNYLRIERPRPDARWEQTDSAPTAQSRAVIMPSIHRRHDQHRYLSMDIKSIVIACTARYISRDTHVELDSTAMALIWAKSSSVNVLSRES